MVDITPAVGGGMQFDLGIDEHFRKAAKQAGKRIVGIETAEFQAAWFPVSPMSCRCSGLKPNSACAAMWTQSKGRWYRRETFTWPMSPRNSCVAATRVPSGGERARRRRSGNRPPAGAAWLPGGGSAARQAGGKNIRPAGSRLDSGRPSAAAPCRPRGRSDAAGTDNEAIGSAAGGFASPVYALSIRRIRTVASEFLSGSVGPRTDALTNSSEKSRTGHKKIESQPFKLLLWRGRGRRWTMGQYCAGALLCRPIGTI